MPFTLAHPAAVLPLRGARFLRTAPLILGAVTPDVPYYVPGNLGRFMPETHDFEGSYTTCLVIGYALLAALFVLQRPLTALLSPRARWLCLHALAPYRHSVREWLWAALAVIVGVWLHLLWDSITHLDGWAVRRVAALSAPVTIAGHTGPMCTLLQYLSSVFGLTVMAVWYMRLRTPPEMPHDPRAPRSAVGPILVLIGAAAVLIGGVQSVEFYRHYPAFYRSFSILLTHSLAWFAALYLLAGAIVTMERHDETPPA
ncbi:MAG: DUF4184 family protein [Proteobacteria bacterium]|nr:DUF4184 family protein [Pseudomonadota bacterium]